MRSGWAGGPVLAADWTGPPAHLLQQPRHKHPLQKAPYVVSGNLQCPESRSLPHDCVALGCTSRTGYPGAVADPASPGEPCMVGRYALFAEIAHGGMATVHLGRLTGPAGFSRTVAIKQLHPNFAKDPEFVAMFMDEARLAARLHHPNVVSIIDVVAIADQLLLVMEYVPGDSLAALVRAECRAGTHADIRVVVKVLCDVLSGLHAAHEARNERGMPLNMVHRDVSPQNVLVGTDGAAHLIDFGVAKASGRLQSTRDGQLKGKIAYMAPEQVRNQGVDRRTDVYSASVVLWEALAGRRLIEGDDGAMVYEVLEREFAPPSHFNRDVPPALDAVVMRGLCRDPSKRIQTALEMGELLEQAVSPASNMQVARWVEKMAHGTLLERARLVAEVESISETLPAPPPAVTTGPEERDASASISSSPVVEPTTQTSATISSAQIRTRSRRRVGVALVGTFAALGVALVAFIAYLSLRAPRDSAAAAGPAVSPDEPSAEVSAAASSLLTPASTAALGPDASPGEADAGRRKLPVGAMTGAGPGQPSKAKAKERYGF
jgi:eukaryotic-like serine/threonine-protein kinase